MHVAILAPCHKSFISFFLPQYNIEDLPEGYNGAPWIASIISEVLSKGHKLTVISTAVSVDYNYSVSTFKNDLFTWIVVPSRVHSFRTNGSKVGRIVDFYKLEQQKMVEELKKEKPDIVHAHWSYEYAGAAIKSDFPYLVTVHDNAFQILGYFKNLYRFFRLLMSEKYLNTVKYASTVSPYMNKYVSKRCENVKIIPNPVNILLNESEIHLLINKKLNKIVSPKICMIFNGWDSHKNGINAFFAFALLLSKIPNATLHLFGSGSEMFGEAYKSANKIGVSNIYFNGPTDHKSLIDFLKESHLLLHPSLEESFGVVLIEAMSTGVPSIGGKNSGAVPWVINDNRLLVDVKNPIEIADKMYELLSDIKLYESLALSGYLNVVNRFSAETVVERYLDYYEEIISDN
jgi:glycosyltransferase involved in cell wall biosynthesis